MSSYESSDNDSESTVDVSTDGHGYSSSRCGSRTDRVESSDAENSDSTQLLTESVKEELYSRFEDEHKKQRQQQLVGEDQTTTNEVRRSSSRGKSSQSLKSSQSSTSSSSSSLAKKTKKKNRKEDRIMFTIKLGPEGKQDTPSPVDDDSPDVLAGNTGIDMSIQKQDVYPPVMDTKIEERKRESKYGSTSRKDKSNIQQQKKTKKKRRSSRKNDEGSKKERMTKKQKKSDSKRLADQRTGDNIISLSAGLNGNEQTNNIADKRMKQVGKERNTENKQSKFLKPQAMLMYNFFTPKHNNNKNRKAARSKSKRTNENDSENESVEDKTLETGEEAGRETNVIYSDEIDDFRTRLIANQNEMLKKHEKKVKTKAQRSLPRRILQQVKLPPVAESVKNGEVCKHCLKPLPFCDEVVYGEYCIARVFDFCKKHFFVSVDDITKKYKIAYTSASKFINYKHTGKLDTCDERIPPVCMLEKSYIEAIQIKGMRDAFNGWNSKMN